MWRYDYEYDDINNTNVFAVDDYYQSNGSIENTGVVILEHEAIANSAAASDIAVAPLTSSSMVVATIAAIT